MAPVRCLPGDADCVATRGAFAVSPGRWAAASVLSAATSNVTSAVLMAKRQQQQLANLLADTAVLGLLTELPTIWATSLDLAQCTGLDHKAAQAAAKRLADLGVITQRTTFYRSARARTRRRFEYCHPGQAAAWHRLPERLEPPLYQINQSSCRVVLGRASLAKEPEPMTEVEYKELPPGVRDRYSKIREEDVSGDPRITTARKRLEAAEADHQQHVQAAQHLRTRRVQLEAARDQLALTLQEQHEARRAAIAKALIDGTEIDVADNLEGRRIVLEAYPVALADIDKQLAAIARLISRAADDHSGADDQLRAASEQARLAEARLQAA